MDSKGTQPVAILLPTPRTGGPALAKIPTIPDETTQHQPKPRHSPSQINSLYTDRTFNPDELVIQILCLHLSSGDCSGLSWMQQQPS